MQFYSNEEVAKAKAQYEEYHRSRGLPTPSEYTCIACMIEYGRTLNTLTQEELSHNNWAKEVQDLKHNITDLNNQITGLVEQLKEKDDQIDDLRNQLSGRQQEVNDLSEQLIKLQVQEIDQSTETPQTKKTTKKS